MSTVQTHRGVKVDNSNTNISSVIGINAAKREQIWLPTVKY